MSNDVQKQQRGFRMMKVYPIAGQDAADKFDQLVGQAALCGTLDVPTLLCFIRPHVANGVIDLDDFAHAILEL